MESLKQNPLQHKVTKPYKITVSAMQAFRCRLKRECR